MQSHRERLCSAASLITLPQPPIGGILESSRIMPLGFDLTVLVTLSFAGISRHRIENARGK